MVILNSLITLTLLLIINSLTNEPISFAEEDSSSIGGVAIRCFWLNIDHFAIFDLQYLKTEEGYKDEYSKDGKTTKISYNFCANAKESSCSKQSQVIGIEDTNPCVGMSGNFEKPNTWTLLNKNNVSDGIRIVLNGNNADVCDGKPYNTTYELQCDPNGEAKKVSLLNKEEFDLKTCNNVLKFKSKEACPNLDILSMVEFFSKNYILFSIIIIILGLFELILGAKILVITIYIICSITIITVVFIFIMQFIVVGNNNPGVFWAVLAISAIAGLVLGFVIARYKKTFIGFILGGYSGYIVGTLIYSTFLNRIETSVPWLVNIGTIIGCIIVFVLIAFFFFDHVVIFSTSLIGAYGVIRGIGTLVGNFPNEIVIMKLIGSGEKEQWNEFLTWWVIGYLIGWGLFFVGGVVVQYIIRKKTGDDDKDKDKKGDKHLVTNDKKEYWLN